MKTIHRIWIVVILVIALACNESVEKVKNGKISQTMHDDFSFMSEEDLRRKIEELSNVILLEAQDLAIAENSHFNELQFFDGKIIKIKTQMDKLEIEQNKLTIDLKNLTVTRDSIFSKIRDREWEHILTDKRKELGYKFNKLSDILGRIRGFNVKHYSENELRILNRDIQYYKNELEQENKYLPDLLHGNSKELSAKLEKCLILFRQAISFIEAEIEKIPELVLVQKSTWENEVSWKDKEIKKVRLTISENKTKISDLVTNLKTNQEEKEKLQQIFNLNNQDRERLLNDRITQVTEVWRMLRQRQVPDPRMLPLDIFNQYEKLLNIENDILHLAKMGKWNAILELMDRIEEQFKSLYDLLKIRNRRLHLFKKLSGKEPFLVHYQLGEYNRYSIKKEVRLFKETFDAQVDILKDFLKEYPKSCIFIEGHADRQEYHNNIYLNCILSEQRAKNIETALRRTGAITDIVNIKVDWFSKHYNLPIIPELIERDGGGVFDRRVEIRVIHAHAEGDLKYHFDNFRRFRDSLKIEIDEDEFKYFKHEDGFWVDLNYNLYKNNPCIKIYYGEEAYQALYKKNDVFKKTMRVRTSEEIYDDYKIENIRSFELGSQVRIILKIGNVRYRIEIANGKDSAKNIKQIKNREFRAYLK